MKQKSAQVTKTKTFIGIFAAVLFAAGVLYLQSSYSESSSNVLAYSTGGSQGSSSDWWNVFKWWREHYRNGGNQIPNPRPSVYVYPTFVPGSGNGTSPTAMMHPTVGTQPTSVVQPTSPAQNPSLPPQNSDNSSIFGAVPADILGSCTQADHDRYVVRGPDGRMYRTWHPHTIQSLSGGTCTFAHEHGDDPSTSTIYPGNPVPFGYVGSVIGMDEPHAGFKCFVDNKGLRNDEGASALHDTLLCFHMGTGGVNRFTERFHSMVFYIKSSNGLVMNVQGMSDVGNVGTICNNPRQQRTVMGLGCQVNSSYEIWENKLSIKNGGNTIAIAIASTAVFDPITVMDPNDKTRLINIADAIANPIFKFNTNRSGYRGCDRESYHGPLSWSNTGSETYQTDAYGNVTANGPLTQQISRGTTRNAGAVDQYGALIMGYKGGSDPQSQFKYHKSWCYSGIGLKN